MKLSPSATNPCRTGFLPPPIPLTTDSNEKTYTKENSVLFKLRTNPTDANSMMYEIAVPYLNTGTCLEVFKFKELLDKVFVGQNVTTGLPMYALS